MTLPCKTQSVPDRFRVGWLGELDARTALAREMLSRFRAMTDDLGGADVLSYIQRSLCERGLWLEYWLAEQERKLADGKDLPIGPWTQAANALQGIYAKLGLTRVAKDVPTLGEYLSQRRAEAADRPEPDAIEAAMELENQQAEAVMEENPGDENERGN